MQSNYRKTDNYKDKNFIRNLFMLAAPITVQELLNSSVNMMDTFMIGRLGSAPVTAVGLSNQVFFLLSVLMFGINSGAAIFMGQYWGKEDVKGVHKVMGISFVLSMIVVAFFFAGAQLYPNEIMHIYSKDSQVIRLGVQYLKIVSFSYVLTGIIQCANYSLKSTGSAGVPMVCTLVSLVSNVALNYVFIFVANMGVMGAAYATLIARTIEVLVQFMLITILRKPVATLKIWEYFAWDIKFLPGYFKVTLPVLLNETAWALGMSVYNIAYKYNGTVAQAAVQIASVVQNLAVNFGMGIGLACGIMVTNAIGAGDRGRAISYSRRCPKIGVAFCIVIGILLAVYANDISQLFRISNEARLYARYMIYVVAVGTVFKTLNYIYVIGVLRSGGDTTFCLLLDAGTVWLIGVPMAFLGAAFLNLPIYITFAMVYIEEVVKVFIAHARVSKNKWAKRIV